MIITESRAILEEDYELFMGRNNSLTNFLTDVCIQYFLDEDDEKLKDSLRKSYKNIKKLGFAKDTSNLRASFHSKQLLFFLKLYKKFFHLKSNVFYANNQDNNKTNLDRYLHPSYAFQKKIRFDTEELSSQNKNPNEKRPDYQIIVKYREKFEKDEKIQPLQIGTILDIIGTCNEIFMQKYRNETNRELKKMGLDSRFAKK